MPHLSYIGDADVGEGANLGAATITANYDGFVKNRTKIGHGARTSVDTTLVAPVEIGDSAYTGAGSVIDEDVPPGALGIARARQTNVEGYAERKAQEGQGERAEVSHPARPTTLNHPPSDLGRVEHPHAVSSISQDYRKRLMVFGGRASGELAAKIAGQLDVDLGQVDLPHLLQRRGLLPLRGVDPRRRRLPRPVDRRQRARRDDPERRARWSCSA